MRTLEEVGSDQVQQRVARYLLKTQGPDASVRVSQARIAAELGTAREVVFRTLRAFSERSMIRTGRLCIRIVDEAELYRVAKGERPKSSDASRVRMLAAVKEAPRHRRQG